MSDVVTDEMVEIGAHAIAEVDGGWDDLPEDWHGDLRRAARVVLESALAGRTVVALPEPDGTSIEGDPLWSTHVDYEETIFSCVDSSGHPVVEGPFSEGPMSAATAEMFGLRLLAAARTSRRLAAGSQVGDQP